MKEKKTYRKNEGRKMFSHFLVKDGLFWTDPFASNTCLVGADCFMHHLNLNLHPIVFKNIILILK